MKIVLEVEDKSYQTILDFISLLPEDQCRVLPEETNKSNLADIIKDKPFAHKYSHQVLPTGTTLLVALTIKPKSDLSDDLKSHLKSRNKFDLGNAFYRSGLSADTQFIEITISGATTQKELKDVVGGIFLQFDGLEQTGILLAGSLKLPIKEGDEIIPVDKTTLKRVFKQWMSDNDIRLSPSDMEKRVETQFGKYHKGGWTSFHVEN